MQVSHRRRRPVTTTECAHTMCHTCVYAPCTIMMQRGTAQTMKPHGSMPEPGTTAAHWRSGLQVACWSRHCRCHCHCRCRCCRCRCRRCRCRCRCRCQPGPAETGCGPRYAHTQCHYMHARAHRQPQRPVWSTPRHSWTRWQSGAACGDQAPRAPRHPHLHQWHSLRLPLSVPLPLPPPLLESPQTHGGGSWHGRAQAASARLPALQASQASRVVPVCRPGLRTARRRPTRHGQARRSARAPRHPPRPPCHHRHWTLGLHGRRHQRRAGSLAWHCVCGGTCLRQRRVWLPEARLGARQGRRRCHQCHPRPRPRPHWPAATRRHCCRVALC